MKELPLWCKEAKKAMIDRDLSVPELAELIDRSRTTVSLAINGSRYSQDLISLISDELNINDEGYFTFKGGENHEGENPESS